MRIKRKNGLKIAAITIALLLCLALAVGITGAWYQAKRQATGTLNMDQGIVIDYKGFNGSETGATWERGTTFELFSTKAGEVQPGAHIKVNAASIKANAESVNFYARVRLEYKFYNGDTEVTLEDPTVLIKTSNLFGSNWEFSSMAAPKDYYYYVENGTTTFKTMVAGADFVELIQSNAEFIIEGEGFKGSNDLEGGGFVVDETTSINKIVVNLVLETLQGDADPAAQGWKFATPVRFAEATGKMETSVNKTETTEDLNVSVDGAEEVPLNEVAFPYDTDTTLTFDSNNVEYVTLTYSNGESETFDAATYEVAENTFQVYADSLKGTVTAYIIGLFNDKEYSGFTFSTQDMYRNLESYELSYYDVVDGVALSNYFGTETNITIPSSVRVKNRDFKVVVEGYSNFEDFYNLLTIAQSSIKYPCTLNNTQTLNNENDLYNILDNAGASDSTTFDQFMEAYPKMEFEFETLCATNSIIYAKKNIKVIGYGAFDFCNNLETITLPDSIISIGQQAFLGCGLTSITIPKSVTEFREAPFASCENLETIEVSAENTKYHSENNCLIETASKTLILGCKNSIIPNDGSVTSIGDFAFYGYTGLTSITIPNTITNIGSSTFSWSGLTTINIGNQVTSIGDSAFYNCENLTSITIPNNVNSIGDSAFAYCSNLESITLPNTLTSIGYEMFYHCSALLSITIPGGVKEIGSFAFASCSGLTSITIPSSVTSIGERAFISCSNLTSITIPEGVTSIADYAFHGCTGLTSITIPNSVTSIGYKAFYYCSSLTSITIPDGVTSIGDNAFDGCSGLTSITIPNSVTSIGDYAFGCSDSLTSITVASRNTKYHSENNCLIETASKTLILGCKNSIIPTDGSVTSIGTYAFYRCIGLTSITIPSSVTSIGDYAFYYCSNLTTTIGSGWVTVSGSSVVDPNTLLKDISYDIKRVS